MRVVADFQEIRAAILERASTSAGQLTINQDTIGSLEFLTPSLEDQRSLLAGLAEQMRVGHTAIRTSQEQLAAIQALPAGLLRRAFSGEL